MAEPTLSTTLATPAGPVEVRTTYAEFAEGKPWAAEPKGEQRWWRRTLREVHAARLTLAALPADQRADAEARIAAENCNMDDYACLIEACVNDVLAGVPAEEVA